MGTGESVHTWVATASSLVSESLCVLDSVGIGCGIGTGRDTRVLVAVYLNPEMCTW